MKTFSQVSEEHKNSGFRGSIEDYARLKDRAEGTLGEREIAYSANPLEKVNDAINTVFRPVGKPAGQVTRALGQGLDQTFDIPNAPDIAQGIGEALPRQIAEIMASGGGSLIPKALGIGSATLQGVDTGSFTDAIVGGASVGFAPAISRGATQAVKSIRTAGRSAEALGESALKSRPAVDRLYEELGRELAFYTTGEVGEQARSLANDGALRDPFTKEAFVENIIGNIAFLPLSVKEVMSPQTRVAQNFGSETNAERVQAMAKKDLDSQEAVGIKSVDIDQPFKFPTDPANKEPFSDVESVLKGIDANPDVEIGSLLEQLRTDKGIQFEEINGSPKMKAFIDHKNLRNTLKSLGVDVEAIKPETLAAEFEDLDARAIEGTYEEVANMALNRIRGRVETLANLTASIENFKETILFETGSTRLRNDILDGFKAAGELRSPSGAVLTNDFILAIDPMLKSGMIKEAAQMSRAFQAADGIAAKRRAVVSGSIIGGEPFLRKTDKGDFLVQPADPAALMTQRFRVQYGHSEPVAKTLSDVAMRSIDKLGQNLTFSDLTFPEHMKGFYDHAKRSIGLAALDGDPKLRSFLTLMTAEHELVHRVVSNHTKLPEFDHINNLVDSAKAMTPTQRRFAIESMFSSLVPTKIISELDAKNKAELDNTFDYLSGRASPEEFVTGYGSMLLTSFFSAEQQGGKAKAVSDLRDALRYESSELSTFARGLFRDVTDLTESIASVLDSEKPSPELPTNADSDKFNRGGGGRLKEIHKGLMEIVKADPEILKAEAQLDQLKSALDGQIATDRNIDSIKFDMSRIDGAPKDSPDPNKFKGALSKAADFIFGKGDAASIDWWDKYMAPFNLTARQYANAGLPIMREGAGYLSDVTSGVNRITKDIMSPFFEDDGRGVRQLKEGIEAFSDTPDGKIQRHAFNQIARKMQEVGQGIRNGKLEPLIEQAFKDAKLSDKNRAAVLNLLNDALKTYQNQANVRVQAKVEELQLRTARLLGIQNPAADHKVNKAVAAKISSAALAGDISLAFQGPDGIQFNGYPDITPQIEQLYKFNVDIAGNIKELKAFYDSRSAFYMSEQRSGDFLLVMRNKDGKRSVDGVENEAHGKELRAELEAEGYTFEKLYNKYESSDLYGHGMPQGQLERFVSIEETAWKSMLANLRENGVEESVISGLQSVMTPGLEAIREVSKQGIAKATRKRKLIPGRERLDYIHTMQDTSMNLAAGVVKRNARLMIDLMRHDPQFRENPKARKLFESQSELVLNTFHDPSHKLRSMLTAYFLGLNVSSMVVEGAQSLFTLIPTIIANGGSGYKHAYETVFKSSQQAAELHGLRSDGTLKKTVDAAMVKARKGEKLTSDDHIAIAYQRALDDGLLGIGALDDANIGRDNKSVITNKMGYGEADKPSKRSLAFNKVYNASQFMLKWYGVMNKMNAHVSFIAGLRHGTEKGLSGTDLYTYAREVLHDSTFSGGAANRPNYLAALGKPNTRSAFAVMHTLKQYTLGMTTMLKNLSGASARDVRAGKFGTDNQKALGQAMAMQLGFAGTLGLPFVAAILGVLEQQFGVNATQAITEGIQDLAGDDEDMGRLMSEFVMNGAINHLTGVDAASRTGLSNILGTSAYQGFNFVDMLGPAPAVAANLFNATTSVARGENVVDAGTSLLPTAFKNITQAGTSLKRHGEVRFETKSNDLTYKASPKESVLFALGFRPKNLTNYYKTRNMIGVSEKIAQSQRDIALDKKARKLIKGDQNFSIIKEVNDEVDALGYSYEEAQVAKRSLLNSIIDRSVSMEMVSDPAAHGMKTNAEQRARIRDTYGQPKFSSEVELLKYRESLKQRLGYSFGLKPAKPDDLVKAQALDILISKGMPRQQALLELKQVGF